MANYPWSMADILMLTGDEYTAKGRELVITVCPFCNGRKKLSFNAAEQMGRCFKCNWSGTSKKFFADRTNTPEDEAYQEILRQLRMDEPTAREAAEIRRAQAARYQEKPEAPLERRHAVYSAMQDMLPLSEKHIQMLAKRGLSKEEALSFGLRSYPTEPRERIRIAEELYRQGLNPTDNIPGFGVIKTTYERTLAPYPEGILVPTYSPHGLIEGYQVRLDNPRIKENGKPENKYRTLSSEPFTDLASTAAGKAHVSWEVNRTEMFGDLNPVVKPDKHGDTAFGITEGPLKARITHLLTGRNIIAIPGVNNQGYLPEAFNYMKQLGVDTVYNLFDMDYVSNQNVADAMAKLESLISQYGFRYVRYDWDTNYKGIDDLYMHVIRGIG